MRVIDPERAHTVVGPEKHDAHDFRPKFGPFFAAKIQWENVFVFFRRVLGEFDRAVGSLIKPIGMFANVRMIRRTIDREIECDLHPAFSHFALEPIEILQRTQRRFDGFVAAGRAPDCPRHARIPRLSGH